MPAEAMRLSTALLVCRSVRGFVRAGVADLYPEIAENVLIDDTEAAIRRLRELEDLGVHTPSWTTSARPTLRSHLSDAFL